MKALQRNLQGLKVGNYFRKIVWIITKIVVVIDFLELQNKVYFFNNKNQP